MTDMTDKRKPDSDRIGSTWQESAMMQIGKAGLTDGIVKEAKRLLKKHKYIKVRALRTSMEEVPKRALFEELCQRTGAELAGVRGNTAVIYRLR
ncbi:MAG: YhbY family RNA-binding protein [Candidatus Thorarchaeota archaeon]